MKNNALNLEGTGKVYRFTLGQMLHSKANVISLVIMFLFSVLSLPVQSIMNGSEKVITMPETVYLENTSGLELDGKTVIDSLGAKKPPKVTEADKPVEELISSLAPAEAAISVYKEDGSVRVKSYLPKEYSFDQQALRMITNAFTDEANRAAFLDAGLPEDGLASLSNYSVESISESSFKSTGPDADTRFGAFGIQYVYAIILLMLCTITASFIIRSVVEEKSSKLIELLMVSVSPLALLLGKILAVMTYILMMFGIMILGFFVSWTVSSRFFDLSSFTGMISTVFGGQSLGSIAAKTIIVVLISLALGFMINSLLSGLVGACCSSMNDVESANMSVVLITMTGYLISCIVAPLAVPAVDIVTSLFPVTAIFVAPVLYLIGRIGLPILAISWVIQAVFIFFLARMAAAVYRELLLAKGERIRMKRLFSMIAGGRKEAAA